MEIVDTLFHLFKEWGYCIVFFGVMLENAGLPVPGETILLAAGFFASRHGFSLLAVMAIATTGAVIGDNLGYFAGRRAGRGFLLKYGRYVFLTEERFFRMERFFKAHGDKTILVARFITGLRVFAAVFAGASHMPWPTFVLFNFLGAILWSVVISLLGYFFGENWPLLEHWIKRAGWSLALVLVALVVGRFLWKRRKKARQIQQDGEVQDVSIEDRRV